MPDPHNPPPGVLGEGGRVMRARVGALPGAATRQSGSGGTERSTSPGAPDGTHPRMRRVPSRAVFPPTLPPEDHMTSLRTLCIVLVSLAALPAAGLQAQGIIIPDRCDECRRPGQGAGLPVESITFETTIEGQVATTHVTQVFRNETRQVLEGTYFFPLPDDASISEFAIWDGDRRLAGRGAPPRRGAPHLRRHRAPRARPRPAGVRRAQPVPGPHLSHPRARHQEAGAHLHAGAAGGERHRGLPLPAGHRPQRRARGAVRGARGRCAPAAACAPSTPPRTTWTCAAGAAAAPP